MNPVQPSGQRRLRGMVRKRSGRIINITSVAGLAGNPGQTNYAAAKAGLLGFSRSAALELGQFNINVNAIAPGFFLNDRSRRIMEKLRVPEGMGIILRTVSMGSRQRLESTLGALVRTIPWTRASPETISPCLSVIV